MDLFLFLTTLLALNFLPAITIATPIPESVGVTGAGTPRRPGQLDITVYQNPGCTGGYKPYSDVKTDDNNAHQVSHASNSYWLSRDLKKHEYLIFESAKPFAPKDKDTKGGCHDLPMEALWFLFQHAN